MLPLTITDLSRGGKGIARLPSGQVVMIDAVVPGDEILAELIEPTENASERFVQARLVRIERPSSQRVSPRCKIFGRCGGCQWQHVDYSLQWRTKVRGVQEALRRQKIAPLNSGPWELFAADSAYGYRNRIQLHISSEGALGFAAAGSHMLVPAERCEIAEEKLNDAWPQLAQEARKHPEARQIELELIGAQAIWSWEAQRSERPFRQINGQQNERLQQWIAQSVRPYLRSHPPSIVYDLYGGSGNLSRALLAYGARIHVVDVRPGPTDGHPGMKFHAQRVVPWLRAQSRRQPLSVPAGRSTMAGAILDPPRRGLGTHSEFTSLIGAVEECQVGWLILVGCNSDAFARDLARLLQRGWSILKMMVIDFFPQTVHVESAALLTRPLTRCGV